MPRALSVRGEGALFFGRRPEWSPDQAASRRLATYQKSPFGFAYARTAFKYGLKAAGFLPGDAVLVPDFICDSIIEPLDELSIEPLYYPVDSSLQPVWDRLERLLCPATKAFMVVHYFGQPQRIPECIRFCREHSIRLIEDNAHGFGATYDGRLLGTFGCMGVSAPRKSFAMRNGAYLYLERDEDLDQSSLLPMPSAESSFKGRLKHWLREASPLEAMMRYRGRIVEYRRRRGARAPYGSQFAFREPPIRTDYGMGESDESFLAGQDLQRVGEVRRRIYSLWHSWAASEGLVPVFPELRSGAIPLVYPALAASAADSQRWYDFGLRNGIDIHSWPTLPLSVVEEDGEAMRRWERMLCLPIHQDMDPRILERRLAFAKRNGPSS